MDDSSHSKRIIRFTAIAGSVVLGLWLLSTAGAAVNSWQLEKSRVRLTTQEVPLNAASFDALLGLETGADRFVQAPHKGSYVGFVKQAGGKKQPATQEITYNQVKGAENSRVKLRYFANDTRGLYVVEVDISSIETSIGKNWEQVTNGRILAAEDYTISPNEVSKWTEKMTAQRTASGTIIKTDQPQIKGVNENGALISAEVRSEILKNIESSNAVFEILRLRDESQTFSELAKVEVERDLRLGEQLPLHKVISNVSFIHHDGTLVEKLYTEVITSSGIVIESQIETNEEIEYLFKLAALELL